MKKIVLCVIVAVMAICFAGCTGNTTTVQLPVLSFPEASGAESASSGTSSAAETVSPADIETPDKKDYENNLEGLCKFLEDAYAVVNSDGNKVEMIYDTIGASGGVRYSFTLNSKTVTVELYEFDTDTLDENALGKSVIDDVRETGKFTVLNNEVDGILSDNGKYIMVYNDPDTSEINTAQKERVIEIFKNFKK